MRTGRIRNTGHTIRTGYALPLHQRMEAMRERGYTFERTPNGIIVHPPKNNNDEQDQNA